MYLTQVIKASCWLWSWWGWWYYLWVCKSDSASWC